MAVAAYLPAQWLPFISDDYVQIDLARHYGPVSGWPSLAVDPLYRCRSTSLVLTYWTEQLFGLNPFAFHLSSLFLHLLNVGLVFALGWWPVIGWRNAAIAAGFFGIQLAPQEAVMWYAAVHELLVFFFAVLAVHAWLLWLHLRHERFYVASLVFFLLALLSKESAVAVVPMLAVFALVQGAKWRLVAVRLLPLAVLALIYAALIYASKAAHGHFNDAGTFSLSAPFWRTWFISEARLFWIWGIAAIIALAFWRGPGDKRLLVVACAWAGIALLPYCFLTYMSFVPSRHTYFASAGEALIVALAFNRFRSVFAGRSWAVWGLAVLIIGHQYGYLWFRKQGQYIQRAAAVEQLVALAKEVKGPVWVHCFPDGFQVAELALKLRVGTPMYRIDSGRALAEARNRHDVFCWNPREHLRR